MTACRRSADYLITLRDSYGQQTIGFLFAHSVLQQSPGIDGFA